MQTAPAQSKGDFALLKKMADPCFGDLSVLKNSVTGQTVYKKEFMAKQVDIFDSVTSVLAERQREPHPNMVRIVDFALDKSADQSEAILKIFFENFAPDLILISKEVEQTQSPLVHTELTYIMYNVLGGLAFLQGQGTAHGRVWPGTIHFDRQRKIAKLFSTYDLFLSEEKLKRQYQKLRTEGQTLFVSPEVHRNLAKGVQNFEFSSSKEDVWALGLTLLGLGTGTSSSELYGADSFDSGLLQHRIEQFKSLHTSGNMLLVSAINYMLNENEEERPSAEDIIQNLPEFDTIVGFLENRTSSMVGSELKNASIVPDPQVEKPPSASFLPTPAQLLESGLTASQVPKIPHSSYSSQTPQFSQTPQPLQVSQPPQTPQLPQPSQLPQNSQPTQNAQPIAVAQSAGVAIGSNFQGNLSTFQTTGYENSSAQKTSTFEKSSEQKFSDFRQQIQSTATEYQKLESIAGPLPNPVAVPQVKNFTAQSSLPVQTQAVSQILVGRSIGGSGVSSEGQNSGFSFARQTVGTVGESISRSEALAKDRTPSTVFIDAIKPGQNSTRHMDLFASGLASTNSPLLTKTITPSFNPPRPILTTQSERRVQPYEIGTPSAQTRVQPYEIRTPAAQIRVQPYEIGTPAAPARVQYTTTNPVALGTPTYKPPERTRSGSVTFIDVEFPRSFKTSVTSSENAVPPPRPQPIVQPRTLFNSSRPVLERPIEIPRSQPFFSHQPSAYIPQPPIQIVKSPLPRRIGMEPSMGYSTRPTIAYERPVNFAPLSQRDLTANYNYLSGQTPLRGSVISTDMPHRPYIRQSVDRSPYAPSFFNVPNEIGHQYNGSSPVNPLLVRRSVTGYDNGYPIERHMPSPVFPSQIPMAPFAPRTDPRLYRSSVSSTDFVPYVHPRRSAMRGVGASETVTVGDPILVQSYREVPRIN